MNKFFYTAILKLVELTPHWQIQRTLLRDAERRADIALKNEMVQRRRADMAEEKLDILTKAIGQPHFDEVNRLLAQEVAAQPIEELRRFIDKIRQQFQLRVSFRVDPLDKNEALVQEVTVTFPEFRYRRAYRHSVRDVAI